MLRLHECLQGKALKVIENLGHSAAAYEAAKARLERKCGGKRRALTLRLEELDAFKQIREGNEKDLEHFAELLDATNQEADLVVGHFTSLYNASSIRIFKPSTSSGSVTTIELRM